MKKIIRLSFLLAIIILGQDYLNKERKDEAYILEPGPDAEYDLRDRKPYIPPTLKPKDTSFYERKVIEVER